MEPFYSETMLLGFLNIADELLGISEKKEKPSSRYVSKKTDRTPLNLKYLRELQESTSQIFRSLQYVWISLDEILHFVECEPETVSADEKKSDLHRASRSNEVLIRHNRILNSKKSLTPIHARLSPIVEAFFVTHLTLINAEDESNERNQLVL